MANRYLDEGVAGLLRDKTRPSRVPPLPRETRLTVIAKTVQEVPPNATHWSRSMMAEAVGISALSVGRIWAEAGLKPHVSRGFKVSNDPDAPFRISDGATVGIPCHLNGRSTSNGASGDYPVGF